MVFELGPQAARFIATYSHKWEALESKATVCEQYVVNLLRPGNLELHLVSARAKTPESVRSKILEKSYGNPGRQLTDQVGVRVITYFAADVDRAASILRETLDVDDARSPDKRSALALREFGYRSVHLVARVRSEHLAMQFRELEGLRVEVQIRSVLEHAWAEIEHEVVYKAGVDLPQDMRRRFSAIAGTLELLETEFSELRRQRGALVSAYASDYGGGNGFEHRLDAARLMAALEVLRPDGLSWRFAENAGTPFPPRVEATCVKALAVVGIRTGAELQESLASDAFRNLSSDYAAVRATVPSRLSHLSVAVIAVACHDEGAARAFLGPLADELLGAVGAEP